jgi:hypothetical protein
MEFGSDNLLFLYMCKSALYNVFMTFLIFLVNRILIVKTKILIDEMDNYFVIIIILISLSGLFCVVYLIEILPEDFYNIRL